MWWNFVFRSGRFCRSPCKKDTAIDSNGPYRLSHLGKGFSSYCRRAACEVLSVVLLNERQIRHGVSIGSKNVQIPYGYWLFFQAEGGTACFETRQAESVFQAVASWLQATDGYEWFGRLPNRPDLKDVSRYRPSGPPERPRMQARCSVNRLGVFCEMSHRIW